MKKFLMVIIFVIVFIGAVGGSFLFVKNSYNVDNKNAQNNNNSQTTNTIEENVINEHIVETNRFSTDWKWSSSILSEFPDDERYHMKLDPDPWIMYNVIDNEEVYKEYAERMSSVLPQEIDFNKNFVILLTGEEGKEAPDLEIVDFSHNEDNGTLNIILKEEVDPSQNCYLQYNAWYAVVNDRSLLRPATKIIIED